MSCWGIVDCILYRVFSLEAQHTGRPWKNGVRASKAVRTLSLAPEEMQR